MRRLWGVLLAVLALSGCIPTVSLNDRAMIRAVAVDLLEDGRYQVTMQVNEAADGSSENGGPEQTALTETGRDLTELLSRASVSRGKQMFLGSARLILVGEQLAREDLLPALRFFNATQQVAPTIAVAVVRGEAGELIHAGEEAGQFSADGVLDVLHKAQEAGYAPASRMLDFFAQEQSQEGAPQLAVLELERHEPPPEAAQPDQPGGAGRTADKLRVAGSALFRAGRMEAVLTPAQTRGLQWLGLDGRMEATPLSVELPPGGLAAANAYLQRATVRAGEAGGLPEFSIHLQVKAAVLELPEDLGPGWEEQVAALQERAVRREVEEALAATAGQGWDPCELYQLARQQAPGCYWGHQEDWGEQLARARFRVEVDCQVIHTGGAARRDQ